MSKESNVLDSQANKCTNDCPKSYLNQIQCDANYSVQQTTM